MTVKLHIKKHGRTRVKLVFVPSHGKRLTKSFRLRV